MKVINALEILLFYAMKKGVLNGQDLGKKTSLAEKVPQTLYSNEFMDFFMSRMLLDFWTKMSS